jgi:hypothetical protein
MTKLNSDKAPQSGKGSDAARLSQSPLSLRRGDADPTDIDPSPVQTNAGERHDYDNTMEPSAPISEGGKEAT